jgi:hypothetical protein
MLANNNPQKQQQLPNHHHMTMVMTRSLMPNHHHHHPCTHNRYGHPLLQFYQRLRGMRRSSKKGGMPYIRLFLYFGMA